MPGVEMQSLGFRVNVEGNEQGQVAPLSVLVQIAIASGM